MKAPLLINADLTALSAATLATLSNPEVIAVNQDPLGVQARRVRQTVDFAAGAVDVWAGPLAGGDLVALLFNQGTKAKDVALRWEDLGLAPGARARVRDLWARRDLGEFAGGFAGLQAAALERIGEHLSMSGRSRKILLA